jgi:hypothetical protein
MDRVLTMCPAEKLVLFEDLQDIPDSMPTIGSILNEIYKSHPRDVEINYRFSDEALEYFATTYNDYITKKADTPNSDYRGIFSKARGQIARIALAIHVLQLSVTSELTPNIDRVIPIEPLRRAKSLMDLYIKHKLALIPTLDDIPLEVEEIISPADVTGVYSHNLKSLVEYGTTNLKSSKIAGSHLMPPTKKKIKNKYPVERAEVWVTAVADAGFGSVIRTTRNACSLIRENMRTYPKKIKQS